MVFADSPSQGVVRNNTLYHTGLGLVMRFPQGWRVKNQPQNITAASPGNSALIDLRMAGPAQGSPAEVLRKLARLGSGSEVTPATVNGLPAATANTSIQGKPTRIAVVFLGKNAYAMGAQAQNSQAMSRFLPEIEAAQKSFHAITGEERALARPLTLRIITARAGITFAELARTAPLGKNAEGYLRVINGMYPSGETVAGQAMKIVE